MYAIKLELKLNNRERTLMAKHAGYARFVYNYGLALYKQVIDIKGGVNKKIAAIRKMLTNVTKKNPEYAWMNQLSLERLPKCVYCIDKRPYPIF